MRNVFSSLLFAVTVGAAAAQMPDSPTGRMAGALGELASTSGAEAVERFLAERVAPAERERLRGAVDEFRRMCSGGEIAGARKTGGDSATVVLEIPEGRCEVSFRVEADAPHRLTALDLGVMLGGGPRGPGLDLDLPTGDDAALAAALDAQLQRLSEAEEFSGVVLLARGGEPFFERAYGLADRAKKRPNTTDTRFDIGSITKLLTRIAVGQLAERGLIDLQATLAASLPDYPNPEVAARITVQQLLDHSSGLGDIFNERWERADRESLIAPRDFFPLFVDLPLAFEPGTSRAYSNAGFVVLGAIVERASGQPYSEYLEEHVFAPAGMTRSGFPARDGSAADLAIGYGRGHDAPRGGELRPNLGMLPIRGCPAGSSSHTARDLLKLDRALRGGRLLGPEWTAWVYGEGGGAAARDGDWSIGVAGGGPGVSAILEGDGELTVVALSNFDPPAAEELGLALYRSLR